MVDSSSHPESDENKCIILFFHLFFQDLYKKV